MSRTTIRAGAGLLAAALVLSGCGSPDERAETSTVAEDPDRLAALEAELEKLREEPAGEEGGEGSATDEGDERPISGDDEAPEPRVFDVNETQVSDGGSIEVTVERVLVHDYHVEVELTATNAHPEDEFRLWRGGVESRRPLLFDEQDRRFEYQHPAGYDNGDYVVIGSGERLEAVMMFGRRLHPDARQLTLRFQPGALEGWEWTIPVTEGGR